MMTANAKNPDRVFEKMRACRFFLVTMAEFRTTADHTLYLFPDNTGNVMCGAALDLEVWKGRTLVRMIPN
jgi:hypothetical protein